MKKVAIFLCLLLPFACFFGIKKAYKPKVFDCFLFFNEFDVLDVRLDELYDKVDRFILVESTVNFVNKPKPLYFAENKDRYAKYRDKIVHVVVDQFPAFNPVGDTDYWEVDNFQRDQIMRGLERCNPHRRDVVLITDVDEIIRREKIDQIVHLIDKKKNDVVFGSFALYRFFFNRSNGDWPISVATSWDTLSRYIRSAQAFRNLSGFVKGHAFNGFEVLEEVKKRYPKKKWGFARINNLGWHFTSLGGFDKFLEKIVSYAHLGANCEYNRNIENIKNDIRQLKWCEITPDFPRYVVRNQERLLRENLIDTQETQFR